MTKNRSIESKVKNLIPAYEQLPLAVSITSPASDFIYINRAFEKLYSYSQKELKGKSEDIINSQTAAAVKSHRKNKILSITENSCLPDISINFRKDGSWFMCELIKSGLQDEKGEIFAYIGIHREITEQKLAEDQLRRQAMVLDQIADRVTVTDLKGNIIYVNYAEIESLGYPREKLIGSSIYMYGDNPDRGASQSYILKEVLSKGYWRGEVANYTADGREIIMDSRIKAVYNEQGEKTALCGIATDITERKLIEKQLRDNEDRYRRLADNLPVMITSLTGDAVFKFWNKACEKSTGYSSDEIIDNPEAMLRLYPDPGYAELLAREWEESGFCFKNKEIIMQAKDRDKRFILWTNLPREMSFSNDDIWAAGIDITEIKNAEAQKENALKDLKKSQKMLNSIVKNVHDIIYRLDPAGLITFITESVSIYGYYPEEMIGNNILDYVCPEDREKAVNRINERRTGDRRTTSFEIRLLTKTLESRDFEVNSNSLSETPVFLLDAEGLYESDEASTDHFIGTQGVARDITERKHAERKMMEAFEEREKLQAQLNQAQKIESVGRLAGGIAHDFNNMLGVILGHTDLAMECTSPEQPVYNNLTEIYCAAKRSADITKQLLAFARKQEVKPVLIDINRTVTGLLSMLKRLIGEDIKLSWLPGKNLKLLFIDPSQIDQILVNLCINSKDAVSGNGEITIATEEAVLDEKTFEQRMELIPGSYIKLTVTDNGSGMDKATMANIFDPFFTTKGPGKGTGLGLATVYGIVKQNKGFINIHSSPGVGTQITIYLPPGKGKKHRKDSENKLFDSGTTGNETILLVEDEPSILEMTKLLLEKQGYQVMAASSPAEAILLAEKCSGKIDMIITDVIMPDMNGKELREVLQSRYHGLKTLFMSGYTSDIIADHGVLDPGVYFIQKPFASNELFSMVRQVLEKA